MLPYGNSHAYTIVKCGEFRLCHDTGSACYSTLATLPSLLYPRYSTLATLPSTLPEGVLVCGVFVPLS